MALSELTVTCTSLGPCVVPLMWFAQVQEIPPFHCLGIVSNSGTGRGESWINFVTSWTKGFVQRSLPPEVKRNISDCFSLYHSKFPWRSKDTSREPRGNREGAALGWSSAVELGWAPGNDGDHGNQEAVQRDSCAQEQLLCKAQQG